MALQAVKCQAGKNHSVRLPGLLVNYIWCRGWCQPVSHDTHQVPGMGRNQFSTSQR